MTHPLELPQAGVWRTGQLLAAGLTTRQLRLAVDDGRLRRLRHGWLADSSASPDVERAVAAGGVLSCVSALAWHGVWTLPSAELHLRCTEHAERRVRTGKGLRRCCHPGGPGSAPNAVDDVGTALAVSLDCLGREGSLIAMDSILNLNLLTRTQLADAVAVCPTWQRRWLSQCAASESGTETLARIRLRGLGIRVRSQAWIPGVGRVDLLVGDRLVLEIDSRAYHTSESRYASDRLRDRRLVCQGYLVVRLTYADVVHDWDRVLPDLLALVRADLHRDRSLERGA